MSTDANSNKIAIGSRRSANGTRLCRCVRSGGAEGCGHGRGRSQFLPSPIEGERPLDVVDVEATLGDELQAGADVAQRLLGWEVASGQCAAGVVQLLGGWF